MTEVVEFSVKNSLGKTIVNITDRNMEAVAWGSLSLGAADTVGQITWPQVDCPMVFLKPLYGTFLYRSKVIPGPGGVFGTTCNVMASAACTVDWVVGGFRRDSGLVGTHGLFLRDETGRVGFDSGRRYLRLNNPPPAFYSYANGEPDWVNWATMSWSNGVVSFPAHPPWTDNTYLCWWPNYCWGDTAYYNWYQGLRKHSSLTNVLTVERRRALRDLVETWQIGAFTEGSYDWRPHVDLTCEFVP